MKKLTIDTDVNGRVCGALVQPVLVLKTRCPSGSLRFALVGVPEQALCGFPWVWIDFGR